MKRKIIGLTFSALLFLLSFPAEAQQPKKVPRIGYMTAGFPSSTSTKEIVEAFRQGLQELGYIEGKNIIIEYRYAEGRFERLPALAEAAHESTGGRIRQARSAGKTLVR